MNFEFKKSMASEEGVKRQSILVALDDLGIASLLIDTLQQYGFHTEHVIGSRELETVLKQSTADLLVLDTTLSGESGLNLCRRVRSSSNLPIIIVSALGSEADRVLGFENGADDYMAKPFSVRELVARIRALMRRTQGYGKPRNPSLIKAYTFCGWKIYPAQRALYDSSGASVALTSTEFDLLLAFCQNPGRVLSRHKLIELIHGGSAGATNRSVDVQVSRLRQKLENSNAHGMSIVTVRLGGYIFIPVVNVI